MEPAHSAGRRHFAARAAGFAAILAVALHAPVLLGRVPFPADTVLQFPPWESVRASLPPVPRHAEQGDQVTEFYPMKSFVATRFAAGEIPTWRDRILLGVPFLPNPYSAYFYPPSALYVLFAVPTAWSLASMLQSFLAALFASLLARRLGATSGGSLAAGMVFALSGGITAQHGMTTMDTALWTPALLLAVESLGDGARGRAIAAAAATFALTVLSGQVEIAFFGLVACVVYFLWRLAAPERTAGEGRFDRRRFAAGFGAAAVLAVGLAAVQIVPTAIWSGDIGRADVAARDTPPLSELRGLLSRDVSSDPNGWGVPIPAGAVYAGIFSLLLAPAAFAGRRLRVALPFGLLLAAATQLLYGLPPLITLFRSAGELAPQIRSVTPGYAFAVFECALAVLAGLGFSTLEDELRERRGPRSLLGSPPFVTALSAALVVAVALATIPAPAAARVGWRGLPGSWAVLAAGAALLAVGAFRLRSAAFRGAALFLLALDLGSFACGYVPFVPRAALYPPTPAYDFLVAQGAQRFRVAHVDQTGPANVEGMYGLSSPVGYDFAPRRTLAMLAGLGDVKPVGAWLSARAIVDARDRRLDLFAVRYLVATTWNASAATLAAHPERFLPIWSQGSVRIFENRHALPRAFLVEAGGAEILADDAALARLRDPAFDPARQVICERPPIFPPAAARGATLSGEHPATNRVEFLADGTDRIELEVRTPSPAVLVLSQAHDPGWRVAVDGEAAELARVDYGLAGVALPPGEHRVRFDYRPRGLPAGALVSTVALAVLGLLVLGARRGRIAPAPPAREVD